MEAEKAYYRETRFFPIMHCLAVRRDIADAHSALPRQLFDAFCAAKALAQRDLALIDYLRVSLPWMTDHLAAVRAVMGDNPWRYGFKASLHELEAMTGYALEDGLTRRRVAPSELFHPTTLDAEEPV
jgi:4,5-dihydroxyphthalate decarboxylase